VCVCVCVSARTMCVTLVSLINISVHDKAWEHTSFYDVKQRHVRVVGMFTQANLLTDNIC